MNKQGQGQLFIWAAIALVILITGLVFSGVFIFSSKFRWILIGIGIFIGMFFIISRMVTTKVTRGGIIITVILLLAGLFFVFGSSMLQEQFQSEDWINVPTIGYYECNKASDPVTSEETTIHERDIIKTFKCPIDKTDECEFILKIEKKKEFHLPSEYLIKTIITRANSQIESKSYYIEEKTKLFPYLIYIPGISVNDKLEIEVVSKGITIINPSSVTIKQKYNPFILWNNPGLRGKFEYTTPEQGCMFPDNSVGIQSDYTSKIISKFDVILSSNVPGITPGTSESIYNIKPYKVRNYIDVSVSISKENIRIQGDKYCSNDRLYDIKEIVVLEKKYKVVNYQGSSTNVACCSGVDIGQGWICKDNKKEQIKIDKDTGKTNVVCTIGFEPCPGYEWNKKDSVTIETYLCINNQCVYQSKEVECTDNSKCSGNTPICDTKNWVCVSAEKVEPDKPLITPKDCKDWESYIEEKELKYNWYNYIGIGEAEELTKPQCKTAGWVYGVIIAVIVTILGISAMIIFRPIRGRKGR